MAVIDKPVPTYPLGWLKRTGATDGVVKEDWAKPVKSVVKPLPLPVGTDHKYVAPAPYKFAADNKASTKKHFSFVDFLKKLAWGYLCLSVYSGLFLALLSLFK